MLEAVGLLVALPIKVFADMPTEAEFKVVRDEKVSREKSIIDEEARRI